MKFINNYILETIEILKNLDKDSINEAIKILKKCQKKNGRIFFSGCGGGAGHASHATNDFRKICNIESYCITDNVSELTARINDEGWITSYSNWLKVSKFSNKDILFVFSVGGGNLEKKVSLNLIETIKYAKKQKGKIISVIGKKKSFAYKNSTVSIVIPNNNPKNITPHTEGLQAVVWHMMVSHKSLQANKTKW